MTIQYIFFYSLNDLLLPFISYDEIQLLMECDRLLYLQIIISNEINDISSIIKNKQIFGRNWMMKFCQLVHKQLRISINVISLHFEIFIWIN
jgi:hypothetical protein